MVVQSFDSGASSIENQKLSDRSSSGRQQPQKSHTPQNLSVSHIEMNDYIKIDKIDVYTPRAEACNIYTYTHSLTIYSFQPIKDVCIFHFNI